jgi:hypothetical protein
MRQLFKQIKSDDIVLSGLATGAIETLMQKTISRRSIENYVKAAGINKK